MKVDIQIKDTQTRNATKLIEITTNPLVGPWKNVGQWESGAAIFQKELVFSNSDYSLIIEVEKNEHDYGCSVHLCKNDSKGNINWEDILEIESLSFSTDKGVSLDVKLNSALTGGQFISNNDFKKIENLISPRSFAFKLGATIGVITLVAGVGLVAFFGPAVVLSAITAGGAALANTVIPALTLQNLGVALGYMCKTGLIAGGTAIYMYALYKIYNQKPDSESPWQRDYSTSPLSRSSNSLRSSHIIDSDLGRLDEAAPAGDEQPSIMGWMYQGLRNILPNFGQSCEHGSEIDFGPGR